MNNEWRYLLERAREGQFAMEFIAELATLGCTRLGWPFPWPFDMRFLYRVPWSCNQPTGRSQNRYISVPVAMMEMGSMLDLYPSFSQLWATKYTHFQCFLQTAALPPLVPPILGEN